VCSPVILPQEAITPGGMTFEVHLHATSGPQYPDTENPCHSETTVEEPYRSPSDQQPQGVVYLSHLG
jgi:hypothetical protein